MKLESGISPEMGRQPPTTPKVLRRSDIAPQISPRARALAKARLRELEGALYPDIETYEQYVSKRIGLSTARIVLVVLDRQITVVVKVEAFLFGHKIGLYFTTTDRRRAPLKLDFTSSVDQFAAACWVTGSLQAYKQHLYREPVTPPETLISSPIIMSTPSGQQPRRCMLLEALPQEIRDQIYGHVRDQAACYTTYHLSNHNHFQPSRRILAPDMTLRALCRQIAAEYQQSLQFALNSGYLQNRASLVLYPGTTDNVIIPTAAQAATTTVALIFNDFPEPSKVERALRVLSASTILFSRLIFVTGFGLTQEERHLLGWFVKLAENYFNERRICVFAPVGLGNSGFACIMRCTNNRSLDAHPHIACCLRIRYINTDLQNLAEVLCLSELYTSNQHHFSGLVRPEHYSADKRGYLRRAVANGKTIVDRMLWNFHEPLVLSASDKEMLDAALP
jgi:hypothetical protein